MRVDVVAIVNWTDLRDTVAIVIVAGAGLSLAVGFLLLGGTRGQENYTQGRVLRAGAYAALATVALATTAAASVVGLVVMAQK